MKTARFLSIAFLAITTLCFSGCKEDDPNDNGVPSNTLIAGGTSISLSSTCTEVGSGNDLLLTAADLAQEHVLEIRFDGWPTAQRTYTLDNGGSGSEAFGSYTVNNNVEYEIQSGTATVTPTGSGFNIRFNDVVAEGNNVEISLSFNGTCN